MDWLMSEEKNNDVEESLEWDESLCGVINNLSSSLNSLMELDSQLLSKGRQAKLARMKRQIFDGLCFYSDLLPDAANDNED